MLCGLLPFGSGSKREKERLEALEARLAAGDIRAINSSSGSAVEPLHPKKKWWPQQQQQQQHQRRSLHDSSSVRRRSRRSRYSRDPEDRDDREYDDDVREEEEEEEEEGEEEEEEREDEYDDSAGVGSSVRARDRERQDAASRKGGSSILGKRLPVLSFTRISYNFGGS